MEKNISQEKRIEELEARLKEQEKLGSLGLLSAGRVSNQPSATATTAASG